VSALVSGRAEVTTAGTRVRLSSASVAIRSITIAAETNNTNPVTVGGSDVVGALLTRKGIPLSATSAPLTLGPDDGVDELSDIYIDAVTDTEGVTFIYSPA
jgi:hypothetical protein